MHTLVVLNTLLTLLVSISSIACCTSCTIAQESKPAGVFPDKTYGAWNRVEEPSGKTVYQMHLRVYPAAAPVPAFKYRLVPDPNDRVDGNAAIFYLKAMGFFEQGNTREALTMLERKWRKQAAEEDSDDYAPNTWADMAPESLPMEQVKEYLQLHGFQPSFLYDAARRTRFEHDRAIEREPNPIGYLLPSIQEHRQLARVQNVRCRFAIAEGRIDDAIEIIGQMMMLGRHLGNDEFFVSNLVGAAIHSIGTEAGLVLSQQPDVPNLYWAIAACPNPAIDLSRAFATERKFLLLQLPILKEVTETVQPPQFWADFTRRFTKTLNVSFNQISEAYGGDDAVEEWDVFRVATVIAADYPVARDFLKKVAKISDEQLDRYPKAQVVFLAIVKYNEFANDEALKQFVLPVASRPADDESEWMKRWRPSFGRSNDIPDFSNSLLPVGDIFVPATQQVLASAASVEQQQRLWQTVEALRMTAAKNGGELPKSLDQLTVPAPLDPATNRPFEYKIEDGVASIRGSRIRPGYSYEIKLELLQRNEQQEKTE